MEMALLIAGPLTILALAFSSVIHTELHPKKRSGAAETARSTTTEE